MNIHASSSEIFAEGDWVLLTYQSKSWITKIRDEQFHTHRGIINLKDLIGKPSGSRIKTTLGSVFIAHRPILRDLLKSFRQQSQVIYPKDMGAILVYAGIKPGDVIVEAGTGSGALTSFLALSVGENGQVITHDNREHALKVAKKNHERLGFSNIEYHLCDVTINGFQAQHADHAILDMGAPWEAIPHLQTVLKKGGSLCVFIPTFNQIEKVYEEMKRCGFQLIQAIELLEREIQLKPGAIRPQTRMIGHTGYLMFARYAPGSTTTDTDFISTQTDA